MSVLPSCEIDMLHLLSTPASVCISHVTRRLNLRRKLQSAIAQTDDNDDRARKNTCPSTLQNNAANKDVNYELSAGVSPNLDPLF